MTRALKIKAKNTDFEVANLGDEAEQVDCGGDCISSLIIASRFRNDLDPEMESESLLPEHPTVGHLKILLANAYGGATVEAGVDEPTQKMTSRPCAGGNNGVAVKNDYEIGNNDVHEES